jgi:hypothetical protein
MRQNFPERHELFEGEGLDVRTYVSLNSDLI